MNKCLNVIGIVLALLLFPYCGGRESQPSEVKDNNAHAALAEIDSLMWRRADSAFVLLQEFVVSPEAKELDTYDEHYCQVLISELLYKNYKQQSNRDDLLRAVDYFDSVVGMDGADARGASVQGRNAFLAARAHYINGVGYYERDSLIEACGEYLNALRMMEEHFVEKVLVGHEARFMALTYNRLVELFSAQYMQEQAIYCGKQSLTYNKIAHSSPGNMANILYHLGKQYDKLNEADSAAYYYEKALETMPGRNSMLYRDVVTSKALFEFEVYGNTTIALDSMKSMAAQATSDTERLIRFLTIGAVYHSIGQYDSAKVYLKPVFEKDSNNASIAAKYLRDIALAESDTLKTNQYSLVLAKDAAAAPENLFRASQLNDLFQNYLHGKQEKAEAERRLAEQEAARLRWKRGLAVTVVVMMALGLGLWCWLARRKKEQEALQQNLQKKEAHVNVLEKALIQQREEAKQWRMAFLKEPICEAILNKAKSKQITTRNVAHELGIALKDEDLERLGEAVAKYYDGFDHVLLSQCPNLKHGYLALCHLHLLGLSESEIAALKNVSYSAIRKQNESLQEKLGVDETISAYVLKIAEGLCKTPNVEQEKQPDMDLQRTTEENSGQPMEMEQESSLKGSLKSSQKILELISASPNITISEIADRLGMTTRGVDKNIKRLKEQGVIRRVGPDKGGHWEVIE
ncbi:MAG: winged helix-turn-helix domain-containing protein [bacterium]|nr:winged helix-turn-helix domain-containing protein [Candidatus Limimorpha caballi]